MFVVVLAGTTGESNRHAKLHKLPKGRFRYASQASSIRGLRVAEVHVLPGYAGRSDKHAIGAVLRYTKSKTVQFGPEGGRCLTLDEALEEAARGQEAGTPEPSEDAAPAPEVAVKRRKAPPKPPATSGTLTPNTFFGSK